MAMYNNIFKITHNDVLPAQGSILISEPFLQDAYFQRSVVLLVEHTQEGSMGFVLNKKTELSVNTFFADLQGFPKMPHFPLGKKLFFVAKKIVKIVPLVRIFSQNSFEVGKVLRSTRACRLVRRRAA